MDRRTMLFGAGIVVAAAAGGAYYLYGDRLFGAAGSANLQALLAEGPLPEMVMGNADAPVTIIEYASMTCPHCANFHENTLPAIKEKYIDTGKARLIFREFPFDSRAAAAFMVARCAPAEQYFPLVDVMFKQQATWVRAEDPRQPLLQIARLAGFTQESFEACLKNQPVLDKLLAVREKAAKEFKVESTPTFFINGEMHAGALPVEEMSKIIDKFL